MSDPRALRMLLVANDGLSAGHVARMIAIAGGLVRAARARDVALRTVLATTSQAHALLAEPTAAVVQLPAPAVARSAGFTDAERRRLVSGAIEGVVRSFAPDLIAIDTFPLGPHRELAGIDAGHAKRALVRRDVPRSALEGASSGPLVEGAEHLDLAVLAADPTPIETTLDCRCVHVPPITLARAPLGRQEARRALQLPAEGRVLLVASGGGGDETATAHAAQIGDAIARLDETSTIALALGPLATTARTRATSKPGSRARLRPIEAAPLAPFLAAFDGAFAPAGYNTAYELALAALPAVLFAQERPFDDQAARAARLDATTLETFDDDAIARALAAMKPLRAVPPGGADRAAEALLDCVMRRS